MEGTKLCRGPRLTAKSPSVFAVELVEGVCSSRLLHLEGRSVQDTRA